MLNQLASMLVLQLDQQHPIKSFTLLGTVTFQDGETAEIDLDELKILAVVAAGTPPKVEKKAPEKPQEAPKAPEKPQEAPKLKDVPKPKEKPKMAPKGKEKPKTDTKKDTKKDYTPPVLIPLCRALGVAEYYTNAGRWMDVAILSAELDTVNVSSIRDGMSNVAFTWTVRDTTRLRNDRPLQAGDCQCDKCAASVRKVA
jgi:type IV secretory pathway VirB10-like protein